jgi:asparagine synthase (glutamine-hydrolysing)
MCGIAGCLQFDAQAQRLDLGRLRHRGPDGEGEWCSPNRKVWLGHTRLAILDLSPSGAQPMRDPSTGNVIVFNGEIYNHRALRQALGGAAPEWYPAVLPGLAHDTGLHRSDHERS